MTLRIKETTVLKSLICSNAKWQGQPKFHMNCWGFCRIVSVIDSSC